MNQNGGKLIASGTYGCVFSPSLDCENNRSSKLYVSKVIDKIDQEDEFDNIVGFNLSKLDPDMNLFIYPEEPLCNLVDFDFAREDIYKCRNIKKKIKNIDKNNKKLAIETINEELSIINFREGGKELYDVRVTGSQKKRKIKTYKLLSSILNLFYGIKVLSDNNIVHRDIKPQNILFDGEKLRLIDFGLSINFTNILDSFSDKISKAKYPYWSIEYNIMYDLLAKKIFNDSDKTNVKISKLMKYISNLQKQNSYTYNPNVNSRKDIIELTNLIIKYKIKDKINDSDYYRSFFANFDIFSLGIVLYFIFFRSNFRSYIPTGLVDEIKPLISEMTKAAHNKRININNAASQFRDLLLKHNIVENPELIVREFNMHF